MVQRLLVLIMLVGCVLLPPLHAGEPQAADRRTVSVRGFGRIATPPDQIRLNVQVNVRGEAANLAMNTTSTRTREIQNILRSMGVEAKDIQTSRVTVTPVLDYEKRIQPPPIVGYTGTNEFSVVFKGKLMDRVGEFIDKAVKAGASSFGGLQYEASRQRELERDALRLAAGDARGRAEVLAKELGAQLGSTLRIAETVAGAQLSPVTRFGGAMEMTATSEAPVMTGEMSITAQVDVVFELK